jgi:8-oxo-dGTP pyrophosphatase MutT (NUDIX family)
VAVCLVEDRQLLIGQRRDGGLCIPCGHVEWDESIEDAAVREFQEETGLEVRLDGIVAAKSNFHLPERQTVGIWYRGQRTGGQLSVGSDLVEVCFVHLHHMPTLKFPTDNEVVAQLQSELWASR